MSIVVSLDGFIAGPGGELDWFDSQNAKFAQYCDEMLDEVGVAVYGRRSYELMVMYWPKAEESAGSVQELAFARKMNSLPKVVVSRTLERATWKATTVVRDIEAIAALKRESGKPIAVWAGAQLVTSLADAGLIDEYRLVVHPVLLGGGTRLFPARAFRTQLRQVRTQELGGRVTVLCYEPVT